MDRGLAKPELRTVNEAIKSRGDGTYLLARTVEIVSPYAPNALILTVTAGFAGKIKNRALSGFMVETEFKAESNRQKRMIQQPFGKYEILVPTTDPGDVPISVEIRGAGVAG